jgi:hypothetical protein
MVGVLMGAGLAALVAGLLAFVVSIPMRDFSFGETLMVVGAIIAGSGLIVVALAQILREVRKLSTPPLVLPATTARPEFPPRPVVPTATLPPVDAPFPIPPRTPPAPERSPPPRPDAPAASDARSPSKRNLLFRRPAAEADTPQPDSAPERETADSSWPQPRPPEGLWKRRRRETPPPPPEPMLDLASNEGGAEAPRVTVLKSGVVDGMGYTLYSDGSIEAQLAEGMVRFESIEALRTHLDQRSS